MNDFFNILLVELWRRAGALGILVAAFFCALPVALVISLLSDPATPDREIIAAARESWTGRVLEVRHDPRRGLIASIVGPAGPTDVMFSGADMPVGDGQTPRKALEFLRRKLRDDQSVVVHVVEAETPLFPMRGHLIKGNEWLNGSLVEEGLARLPRHPSPFPQHNAGSAALRQLQLEAQVHQRGLWRRIR